MRYKIINILFWDIKKMEQYDHNVFINSQIIYDINNAIRETNYDLEGNCLYEHCSNFTEFPPGFYWDNKNTLRENFFKIAKRSKNGVEVGFNGGHSAAVYFYGNPSLKLLAFDICHHAYTIPCAVVLKEKYKYNIDLIVGNSLQTLPIYQDGEKYDFIHIDGGHGAHIAENDLVNCRKFAHENTYLIIDDINMPQIENVIDRYVAEGKLVEINYEKEGLGITHFHKIYRYVL